MDIKRLYTDMQKSYVKHLGDGLVATDGIQYSTSVALGGSGANTEVLNQLINPGFGMMLNELEVGLTQRFANVNGSVVGTLTYYWEARSEYTDPEGSIHTTPYINLTGTYLKTVGTQLTSEDVVSGYVPVGSVPAAPVRLRLVGERAVTLVSGKVKNSSYVRMIGIVIPGT